MPLVRIPGVHSAAARIVARTRCLAVWRVLAAGLAALVPVAAVAASTWETVAHFADPDATLELRIPERRTPVSTLPSAAVLMPAACEHAAERRDYWAEALLGWGYAVAYLDVPATHVRCQQAPEHHGIDADTPPLTTLIDLATGALRSDPRLDSSRVALLGWSRAAVLQALARRDTLAWSERLRAGVAIAPDCRFPTRPQFVTPTLMLAGGRDAADEEYLCGLMMRRSHDGRAQVTRRVYPNANPAFDLKALDGSADMVVFDRNALDAATRATRLFLDAQLHPERSAAAHAGASVSSWAHPRGAAGADLPPAGRSLLDHVLDGGHDIPFPFERLIERLGAHAGPGYFDRAAVKRVLIPIGRSLQRHANAPDYFEAPRIVVAVDTEPDRPDQFVNLKDRLFLGFQPRAGIVEAISWNPEGGRFEFQVIENYRAGETPRLAYANRALCGSCHQNGGPIFARAPWTETNANPRVVQRLRAQAHDFGGHDFHGVDKWRLAAIVEHVDAATDRGSEMAAAQTIWREACGPDDDEGYLCRAGLVLAMLQFRLTEDVAFARHDPLFAERVRARLKHHWQQHWPNGLALADADLDDHDPLILDAPADVPAWVDPLRPRAAAAIWSAPDAGTLRATVASLSGLFDRLSVARLDRHLASSASHGPGPRIVMACDYQRRPRPFSNVRWQLDCGLGDTRLSLDISIDGQRVREGTVTQLVVDGDSYNPILILGGRVRAQAEASRSAGAVRVSAQREDAFADVVLRQRGSHLRVRLPDGNSVRVVRVRPPNGPRPAQVELLATPDFAGVRNVVLDLAGLRHPALSARPFRPARVLRALFDRIGLTGAPVILETAGLPPPEILAAPALKATADALEGARDVAVLKGACGQCHSADTEFPPGFLHGSAAALERQVAQCAPRMLFRLKMWRIPDEQRAKSPMPPQPGHGYADAAAWSESAEFRELARLLERRVGATGGSVSDLPPCRLASRSAG